MTYSVLSLQRKRLILLSFRHGLACTHALLHVLWYGPVLVGPYFTTGHYKL